MKSGGSNGGADRVGGLIVIKIHYMKFSKIL